MVMPSPRAVFKFDEHLDFGRLLHRQIGRLATLKNSPGIDTDGAMCFRNVGPVPSKASGNCLPK
jgi:hypothetical protein